VVSRNRARSRALFDLLADGRVLQPADRAAPSDRVLRRPPAGFSFNTLVKKALGRPASTRGSKRCSRAASIRMNRTTAAQASAGGGAAAPAGSTSAALWPSRDEVHAFADEADRR
jgi:hypothetical protein